MTQGLGLHGPVISQQAFIDYWKIFLGLWFLLQVSLSCGQTGHLPGSLAGNSLHDLYFQWHKQQHWYQHKATNTAGAGYPHRRAPGWEVGPETQYKLCPLSNLPGVELHPQGEKAVFFLTGTKSPSGLAVALSKPLGFLLCGLVSRVCLPLLCSSQSAFVLTNV